MHLQRHKAEIILKALNFRSGTEFLTIWTGRYKWKTF